MTYDLNGDDLIWELGADGRRPKDYARRDMLTSVLRDPRAYFIRNFLKCNFGHDSATRLQLKALISLFSSSLNNVGNTAPFLGTEERGLITELANCPPVGACVIRTDDEPIGHACRHHWLCPYCAVRVAEKTFDRIQGLQGVAKRDSGGSLVLLTAKCITGETSDVHGGTWSRFPAENDPIPRIRVGDHQEFHPDYYEWVLANLKSDLMRISEVINVHGGLVVHQIGPFQQEKRYGFEHRVSLLVDSSEDMIDIFPRVEGFCADMGLSGIADSPDFIILPADSKNALRYLLFGAGRNFRPGKDFPWRHSETAVTPWGWDGAFVVPARYFFTPVQFFSLSYAMHGRRMVDSLGAWREKNPVPRSERNKPENYDLRALKKYNFKLPKKLAMKTMDRSRDAVCRRQSLENIARGLFRELASAGRNPSSRKLREGFNLLGQTISERDARYFVKKFAKEVSG